MRWLILTRARHVSVEFPGWERSVYPSRKTFVSPSYIIRGNNISPRSLLRYQIANEPEVVGWLNYSLNLSQAAIVLRPINFLLLAGGNRERTTLNDEPNRSFRELESRGQCRFNSLKYHRTRQSFFLDDSPVWRSLLFRVLRATARRLA